MARFRWNVAKRVNAEGACVEIIDYRWGRGDTIDDTSNRYVLRWRPYPTFLEAPAWIGESRSDGYGQLVFIPPNVRTFALMPGPAEAIQNIVCSLEPSWLESVCPALKERSDEALLHACFDVRNPHLVQTMQRLGAELASPCQGNASTIEALTRLLVADIGRHFSNDGAAMPFRTRGGKLTPAQLEAIVNHVQSVGAGRATVESLAKICGVSVAHFRRTFKNTTNETVHNYLVSLRISEAKSLLRDTDLILKEVSYRLGFSDPSIFSSAFRRAVGQSPSAFRRSFQVGTAASRKTEKPQMLSRSSPNLSIPWSWA